MGRPFSSAVMAALLAAGLHAAPATAQGHDHGHSHGSTAPMEMRTSVADGAVLTTRLDRIDVTFTPAMRLIAARLSTATGEEIQVRFDSEGPAAATASVHFPALSPDNYTLTYTADMGDHTMSGQVRFTIR